jgi:hypothetical protein
MEVEPGGHTFKAKSGGKRQAKCPEISQEFRLKVMTWDQRERNKFQTLSSRKWQEPMIIKMDER